MSERRRVSHFGDVKVLNSGHMTDMNCNVWKCVENFDVICLELRLKLGNGHCIGPQREGRQFDAGLTDASLLLTFDLRP